MPRETIVVKTVNEPRPEKKNGTVIDTTGRLWSCPTNLLSDFVPDKQVTLEYRTSDFKGKTYFFINNIVTGETLTGQSGAGGGGELVAAIRELTVTLREIGKVLKVRNVQPPDDGTPF